MNKRKSLFFENDLRRRELGLRCQLGHEKQLKHTLYSAITPQITWDIPSYNGGKIKPFRHNFGGIFSLEFTNDGKILAAACEDKVIAGFDAITHKEIFKLNNAHRDCVNGVKFLDSRLFASCSDDSTVALWDLRKMNEKIYNLRGHECWVKNLEYIPSEGLLLSSGFDDTVLGWSINEPEIINNPIEIVKLRKLMRMTLTPDRTKMILCTSKGHMVIIHNLNSREIGRDYNQFEKRNPAHFAKDKPNKIEFITDFPNRAGQIQSLQTHPNNGHIISRNVTCTRKSEFTCVHDIKCQFGSEYMADVNSNCTAGPHKVSLTSDFLRIRTYLGALDSTPDSMLCVSEGNYYLRQDDNSFSMVNKYLKVPTILIPIPPSNRSLNRSFRRRYLIARRSNNVNSPYRNVGNLPILQIESNPVSSENHFREFRETASGFFVRSKPIIDYKHRFVVHSQPRLTHYVQEPCRGQGFIKELSISYDGRVICSPFDCGIRLMMFDENCSEISSNASKNPPSILHTASTIACHSRVVTSTKFAPNSCLIVTGSLGGEIVWHNPIL